jgi:acyl-CoA thioesterase-1
MNMPRVVVLGDSLAVSPASQLNFTTELQARADAAGVRARIANASSWGDTTADGLRRLDEALAIDPQILVVALGANDGLRGVSLPAVERNLTGIIQRAQGRRIRVLLAGMEAPPVNGFDYSIQFHLLFPRLAAKHNIPLVPFLLAGVILNPDMNGPDGIHPNAAGARRIASTVWPYLEPMLRQARLSTGASAEVDRRPPDPPTTPEPPRRPRSPESHGMLTST